MDGERIVLGATEQRRAVVLNRVLSGAWTQAEAAVALGRSERQVRRLLAAYRERGPAALVHGNRGRAPANQLAAAVRARVVELARTTYAGCNDTHLAELLAEREEGVAVSRPTVRRGRRAAAAAGLAGAGSPRSRRPPKHRKRRERAAQAGLLLQADGSPHRWLGPAGPEWTLLAGIDDATGTVPWAVFRAQEDAAGYLLWLRRVAETRGVPVALYVDRHGVFRRQKHAPLTVEEELAGGPLPTQFGRALAELGIRVIRARSPQAKGRVERLFGTLQGRLVAELRLAGVRTLDEANRALARFLPAFNARFGVPPAQPGSAYRPLSDVLAPGATLDAVLCFKYPRIVGADNAVRFFAHRLQLGPGPARRSSARARVEVHERLDGSLAVYHQGTLLAARPAPAEAPLLRARKLRRYPEPPTAAPPPGPPGPPATHPWRQKRIVDTRVPFPDHATWR